MRNMYQNTGLNGGCGWICRQLNKISNLASRIPFAGKIINGFVLEAQNIIDFFDGNDGGYAGYVAPSQISQRSLLIVEPSDNFTETTSEPTVQEETILTFFSDKFQIFVGDILREVEVALNGAVNISVLNKQLVKMAIVKEYFKYNEIKGLSTNAVKLRLQLINEVFNSIELQIEKHTKNLPSSIIKVVGNQSDFKNLFINDIQGQKYLVKQYGQISVLPNNNSTKQDQIAETQIDAGIVANPITSNPLTIDRTFKYVSYGLLAVTAIGVVKSFFSKKNKQ